MTKTACLSVPGRYNERMRQTISMASFRAHVQSIVRQVPPGRVATYGQIAAMIPPPEGADPRGYERIRAQWVGRALRSAPADVPWHRVINSQGRISLPAGTRSAAIQRMRLQAEDIELDRSGRVDLDRFGWAGPGRSWLEEQGLLPPDRREHPEPLRKVTGATV